MTRALTQYCRTFTRQNPYFEFLTPSLYSSKSSWSEHLEFPGTNGLCLTRLNRQQCSEWTPTNPYRGGRQTYQALIWNQIDKLQTCNEAKKTYQLYVFDIPFNLCLVVVGPWSPRTSKRSHPHTWLLEHSSSQIAPQVSFTIHAAPNKPGLILIKAVVKVLLLGRGDLNTGAKGPKCSSTTGSSRETNIVMSPCAGNLLW